MDEGKGKVGREAFLCWRSRARTPAESCPYRLLAVALGNLMDPFCSPKVKCG